MSLAHEEARQRVHEVLQSTGWSGRWLGVLDDLPAPAELEEAGLGWMAGEFPWSNGRTIITTRAGEWVEDVEDWLEVTEPDWLLCDQCWQSSGAMRKCGQCRKVHYFGAVPEASMDRAQAGVRGATIDPAQRSRRGWA